MGETTETSERTGSNRTGRQTLAIAGVGLIGGSIAAAAKSRQLFRRIVGIGRSHERLEAARQAGLIDDYSTDIVSGCDDVDFFVSCLPVDRIPESLRSAAAAMKPGSLVTDAGSVKAMIVDEVGNEPAPGVTFVGSHPLTGSERQGFESADADLFRGRTCVLTPTSNEPPEAVEKIREFWQSLGCEVVTLAPADHDAVLAKTSHLPHLVAAALSTLPAEKELRLAAGGFRDSTRVAAGDPDLWTAIFLANRQAISESLTAFLAQCGKYRDALASDDPRIIRELLANAKSRRDLFATLFNAARSNETKSTSHSEDESKK